MAGQGSADGEPSTVDRVVGVIGRAHGTRGEVAVDVRTDEPTRRFAVGSVLQTTGRSTETLTVRATRWHGSRLLVCFEEVEDRATAEGLRGASLEVAVPTAERPVHPDEFYDHQLIGLQVVDSRGRLAGIVAQVLHLPFQEVLVVRQGQRETLVPFVQALVPSVDLAAGFLVVADDRPGLLFEEYDSGDADRSGASVADVSQAGGGEG